jgi:hypothetical protein
MSKRGCPLGLDSRCQDLNGEIRRKRGDTLVGTLRDTYGETFAPGYRSDMELETLLQRYQGDRYGFANTETKGIRAMPTFSGCPFALRLAVT